MKCDVIYAMVCACCWGLLCIGCTKEDFVFSGNGGGGEVEGENGGEMVPPMVSSDAASFFNFAIFSMGRTEKIMVMWWRKWKLVILIFQRIMSSCIK